MKVLRPPVLVAFVLTLCLCRFCLAFIHRFPPRISRNGGGNGGTKPPRSSRGSEWGYGDHKGPSSDRFIQAHWTSSTDVLTDMDLRGGSSQESGQHLHNALGSTLQVITKPFQVVVNIVSSLFQSKEKKMERELMKKLENTPVQAVVVSNRTVVPSEIVQSAARRSGMIGNTLRTDRVQEFASLLKRWYQSRGYILSSVTGATLKTDSATAEIQVQEPVVCNRPVDITFCKEMILDEEGGNLLTVHQYRQKYSRLRGKEDKQIAKANTNTTLVQTSGKTRPSRVAHALGLKPGKPFQWDPSRWGLIAESGIFKRVLQANPQRMHDGTVQLQILATEAASRHLEYGVTKSLYTGSWEGEIDFQHDNLFGGGEALGLQLRRGTKDTEPSVRVHYTDGNFGLPGGYEVEAFSEFIGDQSEAENENGNSQALEDTVLQDMDKMLDRRGARFTYRNPINVKRLLYSTAVASLERTATESGIREAIGNVAFSVGPCRKLLPLNCRASITGTMTTGVRAPDFAPTSANYQMLTFLPYASLALTTTQVLPLSASSATEDNSRNLLSLALRHSLSTSSRNLPRHEQNAMGFASVIRGGTPNGRISTSVTGSNELRIPVTLNIPALDKLQKDCSIVLFGDWVCARKNNGSRFFFKKSLGLGLRKEAQGIPFKVDFSYVGDGKIKSSFGLGRDFDV